MSQPFPYPIMYAQKWFQRYEGNAISSTLHRLYPESTSKSVIIKYLAYYTTYYNEFLWLCSRLAITDTRYLIS
jgi:hypothetical protein